MASVMTSALLLGGCGSSGSGENVGDAGSGGQESGTATSGTTDAGATASGSGEPADALGTNGSETASDGAGSGSGDAQAGADAVEVAIFAGEGANDFAHIPVANQGSHFLQVGDQVIYRVYGQHAMPRVCTGVSFLGQRTEDFSYEDDYMVSELYSFNAKTQEIRDLGTDTGSGELYYSMGWIYSDYYDMAREEYAPLAYRYDPSTGKREELGNGIVAAVSGDGRYVTLEYYNLADGNAEFRYHYAVYEDGKLLGEAALDGLGNPILIGSAGDYMVFSNTDYESDVDRTDLYAVRFDQLDKRVSLGELPPLDEKDPFSYPMLEGMVADGDTLYLDFNFYAGTGHFYAGGYVMRANGKEEGSAERILEHDLTEPEWDEPAPVKIWMENGKLQRGLNLPGTATYSEYSQQILLADEKGDGQPVGISLYGERDNTTWLDNGVEEIAYLQGGYFIVQHALLMDPLENIGWRTAYQRLHTTYEYVKPDGSRVLLGETPGTAQMLVALAKDVSGEFYYMQELSIRMNDIEDESEGYEVESAYTIAKVYMADGPVAVDMDAYYNGDYDTSKLLPIEELYGYEQMTVFDSADLTPTNYDGYDAPNNEDDFWTRYIVWFDKEGKICKIMPDFAG